MSDDPDRASAPPRLLRALTEELRASEVPPIAWDDMEARLMAKIDASASVASTAPAVDGRAEILVPWDDDPSEADEDPPVRERHPEPLELQPTELVEPRVAAMLAARTTRVASSHGTPSRASWSRGRRGWGLAAAVAAAAIAASWLVVPRGAQTPVSAEPVDLASVAVEPRLGDAFDLAGLRPGDVVEASEGPVTFGRAGVLQWTLSAGGRLRIVSGVGHEEPRHVVALESGALEVDVVPREARASELDATGATERPVASVERFVVEVEGARVAVHGTAFRVVRGSRGVVLDVVRGTVAVGPVAGGEGSGQLVQAPTRATFGLDGSAFRELPALAKGRVGSSALGAPRGAGPSRGILAQTNGDERYAGVSEELSAARGPLASAPPPAAPSVVAAEPARSSEPAPTESVEARGDVTWTADRVRSEVSACIARTGEKSGDGARVTIASSVVVDVDAAGATRAVRFDPPIRPDLQACAQPVLHARFPAGTGRLLVPLEVRLGPAQ